MKKIFLIATLLGPALSSAHADTLPPRRISVCTYLQAPMTSITNIWYKGWFRADLTYVGGKPMTLDYRQVVEPTPEQVAQCEPQPVFESRVQQIPKILP